MYGATDEFGHHAVADKVTHHDFRATLKLVYPRPNPELTILDGQDGRVVMDIMR